jgi:hypothetical protein
MITGNWELERKLTDDMGPLLKLMGRPSWQSNIINKANETFQVTVMKITNEDKKQCHIVEKSVCIFLDSKILKWVEKFARTISKDIDYTRVRYKHRFIDTQGKVFMGDDEKHLGDCEVQVFVHSPTVSIPFDHFVLVWDMIPSKRGKLIVIHWVDKNDILNVRMKFTKGNTSEEATKRYVRQNVDTPDSEISDQFRQYGTNEVTVL